MKTAKLLEKIEKVELDERREKDIDAIKKRVAKELCPQKVRHLALAKLAKLGAAIVFGVGCHSWTPAQQAQLDIFECRVAAIRPYVEAVIDPDDFVRQVLAGTLNPEMFFRSSGVSVASFIKAAAAWHMCKPDGETAPVSAKVIAPPPLYGNRLL